MSIKIKDLLFKLRANLGSLSKGLCIFFVLLLLVSCTNRRSNNNKSETNNRRSSQSLEGKWVNLKEVDGNICKVQLKRDRKDVRLLGVYNNAKVQNYLSGFIGQKLKLVFESNATTNSSRKKSKLYAYVVTEDGSCLNGEILKKGLSIVNPSNVQDSLNTYLGYQNDFANPTAKKLNVSNLKKASFRVDTYSESGLPLSFGSGFFISEDGYAMSNHHVFKGGSYWIIKNCDTQQTYRVNDSDIVKFDEGLDFILFKIPNLSSATYLPIAKSIAEQGDEIYVYGNPEGLDCTLSKGIIAAYRTKIIENDQIQIDAPISPGSSGGPIVNTKGQLVGISTSQLRGDCQNCNFGMNIHKLGVANYFK